MRSKMGFWTVAAAAALLVSAGAARAQVVIGVGSATIEPGGTGTIDVSLSTGGADVAGTENVIEFGAEAQIVACSRNEAIEREATAFQFGPSGCEKGVDCTNVKALVLSFSNLTPIDDGVVLYSCEVQVADGVSGTFPLTCSAPGASDPVGGAVEDISCSDGVITVGGPVPMIKVGSATGEAGDLVSIDVSLTTEGEDIAGTENVIDFGAEAQIVACTRNEAIEREATAFQFGPSGCEKGVDCTNVKALVLSFSNLTPIDNGAVLYSCDVQIAADAPEGDYPLTCSAPGASDPVGGSVDAGCSDGTVTVGGEPTPPVPTDTPTYTPTIEVPTDTPTIEVPTDTPTEVPMDDTPTVGLPSDDCDDDGCQIVAPADSQFAWLLLMPAAVLLWLRRRSS